MSPPILLGGGLVISAAIALVDLQRRGIRGEDPIVLTVEEGTLEIMLYDVNDLIRDQVQKSNTEMSKVRKAAKIRNTQTTTSIEDNMTTTISENNDKVSAVSEDHRMNMVYDGTVNRAQVLFQNRKRDIIRNYQSS
jgi:hypothetical protein